MTQVTLCLCPCYWYLLCRVNRITCLSRCPGKPSKDDLNKKLNTSLTNRKSESDLKCGYILSIMVWLAGVSYCTQLFNIGCIERRCERLAYMQIYTAVS